jgi:protease I
MKKKSALIITGNMVQDHEFIYPFYRLKEEGIETTVFNGSHQQVLGYFGTKIPPQKDDKLINLKDINYKDFDLLIIPGGVKAMEHMRLNKDLIIKINEFNANKKIIGCICSGVFLMISANIVKGKKISGYYAWKDDIVNAGATFIDKPVVIDNNIITSPHYKYVGEWMGQVLKVLKDN